MNALTPEERIRAAGGTIERIAPTDALASVALGELGPLRLDAPYLVKRLILPGDLALLVGPPASGKTTVAPDLVWHIAAGMPFLGRRTCPTPVLYVPLEDHDGLRRRFAALEIEHGTPPPPIRIATRPMNLLEDGARVIAKVAEKHGCGLVIVDTLNAACPGLDENSPSEMSRVVAALRAIASPTRAVIATHHTPRNGQHPRGHSALEAAADCILSVIPPEDGRGPRTLKVTKCRHGPAGEQWPFIIRAVALGTDADGEEVVGLVPEWGEPDKADRRGQRPLSAKTALAWRMLHAAILDRGEPLPEAWRVPGSLRGVPLEAWREECERQALSDTPEAVTKAFRRALDELRLRGMIGIRDHRGEMIVWATQSAA